MKEEKNDLQHMLKRKKKKETNKRKTQSILFFFFFNSHQLTLGIITALSAEIHLRFPPTLTETLRAREDLGCTACRLLADPIAAIAMEKEGNKITQSIDNRKHIYKLTHPPLALMGAPLLP